MQSRRLVAFVAAVILCGIAVIGIIAVISEAEDGALAGKLIYATLVLTVFSLVGLAGVLLSVRRPGLAWLGYLTVVAGLAAFALIARKIWNRDGFFDGTGWEVSSSATLIALGLGQVEAQATSLAAILPTVVAGTWRQAAYGNVRWKPALLLGLASVAGVVGGAQVALALPEDALRRLFAVLLIAVAAQVAWRARTR